MLTEKPDAYITPIHATDDYQLNWGTVGVPYQIGAEEARGVNRNSETWAVQVNAGVTQQLTFRLDPQNNFWIDGVTCHLFTVTTDIGGNKLLTSVNPATTLAPVYLRAQDSRQDLQRNAMLWSNLAGRGLALHWLGLPQVLYGGNTITMMVQNQSDQTNYAIVVVLHGRRRRAYKSGGGFDPLPDPKWMEALVEKQRMDGTGLYVPLSDFNDVNARRVGLTHFHAREGTTQYFTLAGTSTWTLMQNLTGTIYNDPAFSSFIRYARYQCIVPYDESVVTRPPVFVQLTDDRFQCSLSNMPILLDAAFGIGGGRPYIYPVDWVWERRGTIHIDVYSAINTPVQDHRLWLSWEGWWRRPEGKL